jgi:hypothetical protein
MTISTDTTLLHDPRRQASLLYWQGFSVPQIAEMLQVKRPTVQSWKQRDGWDETAPINRVESSLEARLIQLIAKPQKSGGDFKVVDFLGRQMERWRALTATARPATRSTLTPMSPTATKAIAKSRKRTFSATRLSRNWRNFFDQSFEYQLSGTAQGWSTVFATFSNRARLARRSIFPRGAAARAENRP